MAPAWGQPVRGGCRGALALIGMLLLSPSWGAELRISRVGTGLGVVLQGMAYPPTLTKDLKSGLTTHLLIHLTLLHDTRAEAQRDIDVAVHYDLWDENFPMTETADHAVLRSQDFATLEQLTAFLTNLAIPQALPTLHLVSGERYRLQAQILLNPIERERMERLKQWVADNAASERPASPTPTAPLGRGASVPPAVAPPDSVFNRIFQQYASGVDSPATWQQTLVSSPFVLQDLTP